MPTFNPPPRILMGPGPSAVDPRVLGALAAPTIGHLDPAFLAMTENMKAMLRTAFGTQNQTTFAVSATGSAGMEACLVNLLEPGDALLVGVNGVFGERLSEVGRRAGAEVTRVEAPWGRAIDPEDLRRACKAKRYKAMAVVHAETSTGVLQDLGPLRAIADEGSALLVVDCVTSLGGEAVELDRHGVDAAYSGTQKCLSCPPGLSPVSFSERALAAVAARKSPCQSWYLDLKLLGQYWGSARQYHHTAPVNMLYALHEALVMVDEETLPRRIERHRVLAAALGEGLQALGFPLLVPASERLAPLTLVGIPPGINDVSFRSFLLERYGLEIGAGLGAFKGKAWRIGLMGASCTSANVILCLGALADGLRRHGVTPAGDGVGAAQAALRTVDEAASKGLAS